MKNSKTAVINTCAIIFLLLILLISGSSCSKPRVYRVGIFCASDSMASMAATFKTKMTELGYIEGKNIIYDFQQSNNVAEAEKSIAEKFVADKVDLIFAFPTEPAFVAKKAAEGTKVPIVFGYASVEGTGLINSVKEPGGNITGVRFPGFEMIAKRLEILREILPGMKAIYVPYTPNHTNSKPSLDVLKPEAQKFGITVIDVPLATPEEIQADIDKRFTPGNTGIDAIFLLPESLANTPPKWAVLAKFAEANNIPIAASTHALLEKGAIFTHGSIIPDVGKMAAPLADKILKGAKAGEIPVVTADQVIEINLKQAQKLGITVPESILAQAAVVLK